MVLALAFFAGRGNAALPLARSARYSPAMSQSLRSAYRQRLEQGALRPDPAQGAAVEALCRLESDLNAQGEPSFLAFLKKPKALKGVYLWGPVGRGKSMLMDMFFESAPVERKRRAHFYAFMAEVHGLIDQWRKGDAAERRRVFGQARGDDPIAPAAALIASQARLLCFDELQVTDIADAMILGRLFEALFEAGVTLVATSNRPPGDLYTDGVNRQLFVPFIALIEARLDVVAVCGPNDYRLDRLRAAQVYLTPADAANRRAFDTLWTDLLGGVAETGASIEVLGRTLRFPRAAGGLLRATFEQLCAAALGPQDYLAVAGRFHTLFLEDLPVLEAARRNEARRLVTLIDALYEAQAKLVVLAQAEPDALYPAGDGAFEFARTASRLQEMRSAAWLERARA
jgi:cell division protein ZapE